MEKQSSSNQDVDVAFFSIPFASIEDGQDIVDFFENHLKLQLAVYEATDRKGNPCIRFAGHEDVVKMIQGFVDEKYTYRDLVNRANQIHQEIQIQQEIANKKLEEMADRI